MAAVDGGDNPLYQLIANDLRARSTTGAGPWRPGPDRDGSRPEVRSVPQHHANGPQRARPRGPDHRWPGSGRSPGPAPGTDELDPPGRLRRGCPRVNGLDDFVDQSSRRGVCPTRHRGQHRRRHRVHRGAARSAAGREPGRAPALPQRGRAAVFVLRDLLPLRVGARHAAARSPGVHRQRDGRPRRDGPRPGAVRRRDHHPDAGPAGDAAARHRAGRSGARARPHRLRRTASGAALGTILPGDRHKLRYELPTRARPAYPDDSRFTGPRQAARHNRCPSCPFGQARAHRPRRPVPAGRGVLRPTPDAAGTASSAALPAGSSVGDERRVPGPAPGRP